MGDDRLGECIFRYLPKECGPPEWTKSYNVIVEGWISSIVTTIGILGNAMSLWVLSHPGFQDVFTVSALYGDGIEDLREYLLEKSQPSRGVWKYNQDLSTDKDPRELVINVLKSKFLDVLSFDVPYTIEPVIETWSVENGILKLLLSVTSNKPRTTDLLLSHKASNLRKVAKLAERDLQNLFHCEVFVVITVNVTHAPKKPLFQQPVTTELGIDRHLHLH